MLSIVVLTVLVALIFDFINGFHDSANSIATVVSTRVLSPGVAVVWAAVFNFAAAFVVGTIELVTVISSKAGFDDVQPFAYISSIDLNRIGYFIVGVFLVTWLGSVAIWKYGRIEQRYSHRLNSSCEPAASVD